MSAPSTILHRGIRVRIPTGELATVSRIDRDQSVWVEVDGRSNAFRVEKYKWEFLEVADV